MATAKTATGAPHPAPDDNNRRDLRGGDRDYSVQGDWIFALMAHSIATDLVVVAELGTAVAAAAAVKAEKAGTATGKNGGGGNTKSEENQHQ
jgi:hypothetical protein